LADYSTAIDAAVRQRLFTTGEDHRLATAGVLGENDRAAGDRYADERVVHRGERVAPEAFADPGLTLDNLIGPRPA
jgi:hypothetical protein